MGEEDYAKCVKLQEMNHFETTLNVRSNYKYNINGSCRLRSMCDVTLIVTYTVVEDLFNMVIYINYNLLWTVKCLKLWYLQLITTDFEKIAERQ